MKVKLHIPTEQYGFCEAEFDIDPKTGWPEVRDEYDAIKQGFAEKPQNTLSDKEQKEITDYIHNALNGAGNSPDTWEKFHPIVKQVLKCYRNAQSRKKPLKEDN